jgi:hypothetical protein
LASVVWGDPKGASQTTAWLMDASGSADLGQGHQVTPASPAEARGVEVLTGGAAYFPRAAAQENKPAVAFRAAGTGKAGTEDVGLLGIVAPLP